MKQYRLPKDVKSRAAGSMRALIQADLREARARARFIELAAELGLVRARELLAACHAASKVARR